MTSGIQWDATVRQELTARGVTEKTGVYGEHRSGSGRDRPSIWQASSLQKCPLRASGAQRRSAVAGKACSKAPGMR